MFQDINLDLHASFQLLILRHLQSQRQSFAQFLSFHFLSFTVESSVLQ